MTLALMIDNWTLQDVGETLTAGLTSEPSGEIVISEDRASHDFVFVPFGLVQIDTLLTLLTNIALYDELLVDERFTYAWDRKQSVLTQLIDAAIIKPAPFSELGAPLHQLREQIATELAVTPTLRDKLEANRTAWKETGQSADRHMSALMWGGAGMLARSHLSETPYFGHTFRRRLIEETRIFSARRDASARVTNLVAENRTQMFRFRHGDIEGSYASFSLPPVAVEIIEESHDLSDLIPTAIQIREKFRKLRGWIAEYQRALDTEDEKQQMSFERALKSVAQSVESRYRETEDGGTGISISVGWFGIDLAKNLLRNIRNRFGVRAMLADLIVAGRGVHTLRKLLGLLGEDQSTFGRELQQLSRQRYGRKTN